MARIVLETRQLIKYQPILAAQVKGPYPRHVGEYCGNFHPESDCKYGPLMEYGVDRAEQLHWYKKWLSNMRFGKPRACRAGTVAQMMENGYVGLYIARQTNFFEPNSHDVFTPPELMEPGLEAFYNLNNKPGLDHNVAMLLKFLGKIA